MNNRTRALAVLNYQPYDRLPVVHFGFRDETLEKWAAEGHITAEQVRQWGDGNAADFSIGGKLGFDFNLYRVAGVYADLLPRFERKVLEELPDGSRKIVNGDGVVIIEKDDATCIPTEIDQLFKGRKEWEEHFLPRLQPSELRIFRREGIAAEVQRTDRDRPLGLYCTSLYGRIHDILGMVNLAFLQADDPALFDEIIDKSIASTLIGKIRMPRSGKCRRDPILTSRISG